MGAGIYTYLTIEKHLELEKKLKQLQLSLQPIMAEHGFFLRSYVGEKEALGFSYADNLDFKTDVFILYEDKESYLPLFIIGISKCQDTDDGRYFKAFILAEDYLKKMEENLAFIFLEAIQQYQLIELRDLDLYPKINGNYPQDIAKDPVIK